MRCKLAILLTLLAFSTGGTLWSLPRDVTERDVRRAAKGRWTASERRFFLDEFERIYDWENDFGRRKRKGEFPKLSQFFMGGASYLADACILFGQAQGDLSGEMLRSAQERLARILSKYDLVTVNIYWPERALVERQEAVFRLAKQYHDTLKILAYIPTEIPPGQNDGQGDTFLRSVRRTAPQAGKVTARGQWTGQGWKMMDYTDDGVCHWYLDLIEDFVFRRSHNLYDGVQFDQIKARHHVLHNVVNPRHQPLVDFDKDGKADLASRGLRWMQDYYIKSKVNFLRIARERYGDARIILGIFGPWRNVAPENGYYRYANGHIEETAFAEFRPPRWMMKTAALSTTISYPKPDRYYLLGARTRGTEAIVSMPDRREARFGLAFACLAGCHWYYDSGGDAIGHEEIWWFPEYNCNLGLPRGEMEDCTAQNYLKREFQRGIVVLNGNFRKVEPGGGYFPRFRADLYASAKTTANIVLEKPMYSMAQERMVKELHLAIYDADILLDTDVHVIPKKAGPGQCYQVRAETFLPWIEKIRGRAP